MPNADLVFTSPKPQVALTALTATPQTFVVNMQGMNTLMLDCDFTRVAGTAVVVSLSATTGENVAGVKPYTVTDYAAKTLTDATFTYTSSASFSRIFSFSLTGLGITALATGNVTVSVSATAGTTDSIIITPITAAV